MNDKCFLDSNIVIYLFDKNKHKKEIVIGIVRQKPMLSSQVIIECLNISIKKLKISKNICFTNAKFLMQSCGFFMISVHTLIKSFEIAQRYHYSHLDSLIIASALEANCSVLYSEDMQHNQKIEGKLTSFTPLDNCPLYIACSFDKLSNGVNPFL